MKMFEEMANRAEDNLLIMANNAGLDDEAIEVFIEQVNNLRAASRVIGFVKGFDSAMDVQKGKLPPSHL